MSPWLVATVVLVALLALAGRLAFFSVKRNCPFVMARARIGEALAGLATVADGTEVCIVARDLAPLASSRAWATLLAAWVARGASVQYLVQRTDEDGLAVLRRIAAAKHPGLIELLVVKDEHLEDDVAVDASTHNFVIFNCPDQLWLEGRRAADDDFARDCEYVPHASGDERWGHRAYDFTLLRSCARAVDLAGG